MVRDAVASGARALDVAVGTGMVAREACSIVGGAHLVTGVDPSSGMIRQAVAALGIRAAIGIAESLPLRSDSVDFLSMGYALRHISDLRCTFREFHRVLRPGGTICVLEITRPRSAIGRGLMRGYMQYVMPCLMAFTTRRRSLREFWQYYWDTIDTCVPPDVVMDAMSGAGFVDARRNVELGIFSEYTARKP